MSSSLALAMLAAAPLSFLICTSLVATAKRLLLHAAWRRASGGKEGEGASIGQALDSAIIPPALPHSLPPRPPLFRDRAGDEESGDSVYGGRPSHALPCRGLAGNIQEEGGRTVGLATLPQIVFAVAAFPSLGAPSLSRSQSNRPLL